jgi:MFS transporter, ACS family, allantoate permease
VGNLIGPQVFQSKDAPQYRPAEITIIVCWGLSLALLILIRQINIHRNKKKDMITSAAGYTKIENGEFLDMTDVENPGVSVRIWS